MNKKWSLRTSWMAYFRYTSHRFLKASTHERREGSNGSAWMLPSPTSTSTEKRVLVSHLAAVTERGHLISPYVDFLTCSPNTIVITLLHSPSAPPASVLQVEISERRSCLIPRRVRRVSEAPFTAHHFPLDSYHKAFIHSRVSRRKKRPAN